MWAITTNTARISFILHLKNNLKQPATQIATVQLFPRHDIDARAYLTFVQHATTDGAQQFSNNSLT